MDNNQTTKLTHGQNLMGVKFNPSNNPAVDKVKALYAEIDDILNEEFVKNTKEAGASKDANILRTLAEQQIVLSQMAVVKSLTWDDSVNQ